MSDELPDKNNDAATRILDDILSRKGLGTIWRDYWKIITPDTQIAVLTAWAKIIKDSLNDG
jgi:hypothetical protein